VLPGNCGCGCIGATTPGEHRRFETSPRSLAAPLSSPADILLGMAAQLTLALVPILGAVRRTIREAINDCGVDKQSVGISVIDRLLARFRNPDPAFTWQSATPFAGGRASC
jgi:hypothetical protein